MNVPGSDTARKAKFLYDFTKRFQEALTSVERCPQPVIAVVHSACVGGGEDLCVVCCMPVCVRVCVCCMFIPHKPPGYFLLCFSLSPSSPIPLLSPPPSPSPPSPPPLPPPPLPLGVDLIAACDIRYCSADSWYQVKEVDIGIAADIGTLQRLPKIVGNHRCEGGRGGGGCDC